MNRRLVTVITCLGVVAVGLMMISVFSLGSTDAIKQVMVASETKAPEATEPENRPPNTPAPKWPFSNCPLEIGRTMPHNHWISMVTGSRPKELFDQAAIVEPRTLHHQFPGDPNPKLAKTKAKKEPKLHATPIPRIVMQFSHYDSVPKGMRDARAALMKANPNFKFYYFSDRAALEYLESWSEFPGGLRKNSTNNRKHNLNNPADFMDFSVSEDQRRQSFSWLWLALHGGFVLGPGFVPSGDIDLEGIMKQARYPQLIAGVDVIGSVMTDFIGASPGNPVIFAVLKQALFNVADGYYGPDFESPTGATLFADVLRSGVHHVPSAYHTDLFGPNVTWAPDALLSTKQRAKKQQEEERQRKLGKLNKQKKKDNVTTAAPTPAPENSDYAAMTASPYVKAAHYKLKPGRVEVTNPLILQMNSNFSAPAVNVYLFGHEHRWYCVIGKIWFMDVDPKDAKSSVSRVVLWTNYPRGFVEGQWYRIHPDDHATIWRKRHMYRSMGCNIAADRKQINLPTDRAPTSRRVLVDIAHHIEAKELATTEQKIPRIIMQTNRFDRIPIDMRKVMQRTIDMNPEYDHLYYSDARIRDFMKANFDEKTVTAFNDILPGAFKADLFRYAFLYKVGGVYIDCDFISEAPLRDYIKPEVEFLSAEDCGSGNIHNGFMAVAPGHPLMKDSLDTAVDRITRRQYGAKHLSITGPVLLREQWDKQVGEKVKKNQMYKNGTIDMMNFECGWCESEIKRGEKEFLMQGPYPTYRSELRWYTPAKHGYYSLWLKKEIYVDRNNEPQDHLSPAPAESPQPQK